MSEPPSRPPSRSNPWPIHFTFLHPEPGDDGAPGEGRSCGDPTYEDEYWRAHWKDRPYIDGGFTCDQDYGPAYRYGVSAYLSEPGRRYDEVEPDLSSGWEGARSGSRLDWERARAPAREAWEPAHRQVQEDSRSFALITGAAGDDARLAGPQTDRP